ncbi:maleylpyruvate isomerase family mycothiol-dependent enzyme [Nocardioides sp. MAHUQ-72]|uniref:maleylpyruvate isomerase family mycothiol-dependent enzyme n=1 Tax=unclassified Nocardioides TaxID=2615069 RepID=UPI0036143E2E
MEQPLATLDAERAWGVIVAERRGLADLLAGLAPAQWEGPSLCTRWRIRDVAAHLALVPHPPSALSLALGAVRARGSFHRLNEETARRHAAIGPDAIVAELREHAESRKVPVVSNADNVLFDILVHGQDIAVPLGIDRPMDLEAARAGADRVWAMGWPFHARRRLAGLRLVATDIAWARGTGLEVRGPIRAHLLALTGRPAARRELSGPGTEHLPL